MLVFDPKQRASPSDLLDHAYILFSEQPDVNRSSGAGVPGSTRSPGSKPLDGSGSGGQKGPLSSSHPSESSAAGDGNGVKARPSGAEDITLTTINAKDTDRDRRSDTTNNNKARSVLYYASLGPS